MDMDVRDLEDLVCTQKSIITYPGSRKKCWRLMYRLLSRSARDIVVPLVNVYQNLESAMAFSSAPMEVMNAIA